MRIQLLILLIPTIIYSQKKTIEELQSHKIELQKKAKSLQDSIDEINIEISKLESDQVIKSIRDSSYTCYTIVGAKLRKNSEPTSEIISVYKNREKAILLDYRDGYFGLCINSVCGYMSEQWLEKNLTVEKFMEYKINEQNELKKLAYEKNILANEKEEKRLEKVYIKKYGQTTYNKLIKGQYWIGMNQEMAIIALGNPEKINSNVGKWGIHEQWVYKNFYLYFENGKLSSYQN